ncbi:hypothetical protein BDV96DRAFT_596970 [Lophiotrema nucula]|uniref:Uncharacterized protein n=1 Tax=Lophiotrema nucula TaxID=690887 RepID=A0A6A5ZFT8_9PLEO|nr:hypothetical protein BDV96DRAFT_596970 [Lophiotrema nucula]
MPLSSREHRLRFSVSGQKKTDGMNGIFWEPTYFGLQMNLWWGLRLLDKYFPNLIDLAFGVDVAECTAYFYTLEFEAAQEAFDKDPGRLTYVIEGSCRPVAGCLRGLRNLSRIGDISLTLHWNRIFRNTIQYGFPGIFSERETGYLSDAKEKFLEMLRQIFNAKSVKGTEMAGDVGFRDSI